MHPSAYKDAESFVRRYLTDANLQIADVGSYDYNGTLRPLFNNPTWKYTGLDVCPGPNVDIVLATPYSWQMTLERQFDVVVSTQTLEHVPHPWLWIGAVEWILKPGGVVYICAPHTMPYHECPIDCWRVYPAGMEALLRSA